MVRSRLRVARRASGSFGDFVHDDAVAMDWSHFVGAKGDAGDYIESRFPSFGSPRNGMAGESVSHFYPLPESVEFRATSLRTSFPPPCSLFVQMACRMDVYTQAKQLGIQTEFVDGQGHRHVTDATALKIILNALP